MMRVVVIGDVLMRRREEVEKYRMLLFIAGLTKNEAESWLALVTL